MAAAAGPGNHGPGGGVSTTEGNYDTPVFSANYISLPLGLPLVGSDNGNALSSTTFGAKFHGDHWWLYTDNANGTPARGALVGGNWGNGARYGRFTLYQGYTPASTYADIGLRCALPAQ